MVYALAPDGMKAAQANRVINELIDDDTMPLALWHDHFLGGPGGCVIFYVEDKKQQQELFNNQYLIGWKVDYRPMVFSFSPSAFDDQIAYTLKAYSNTDWDEIRQESQHDSADRDLQAEAATALES